jgi:hypothetical protein
VCDIHFARKDFFLTRFNKHRPLYLKDLSKFKGAVPSLYLDKHSNLAARKKAGEINEPKWWKLLESPKDYDFDIDNIPRPKEKTKRAVITGNKLGSSNQGIDLPLEGTNINDFTFSNPFDNQSQQDEKNTGLNSHTSSKKLRLLLPKPVIPDHDIIVYVSTPDDLCLLTTESEQEILVNSSASLIKSPQVENSDYEEDSLMQDEYTLDNEEDEADTNIKQHKVKANKILSRSKCEKIQKNDLILNKAAEDAKKKLKLFRAICTSPLNLPSPQWAVQPNFDANYVVISKVSHSINGFCLERGICFNSDMSWPDIRINGQVTPSSVLDFSCIADIEKLIEMVDKQQ